MKYCDLHIHSLFSDSDASIEDIFKEAKKRGVSCIAITDHDTVEGLDSADAYSKVYGVELIQGVELSAQHNDMEVHILGYFIDSCDKKLQEELVHIKELRRERIIWMAAKLSSLGVSIDKEELLSDIKNAVPTRLHLGLHLVKKKKVNTLNEAFRKYLSPGSPAYRSRFKYSAQQAIEIIKNFGGLSFLAHPHILSDQKAIGEIISFGLDGLEVAYPSMSEHKSSFYKDIVGKKGLLQSGGSDAHGSYKEYIKIGQVNASYQWVTDMKKRLVDSKHDER